MANTVIWDDPFWERLGRAEKEAEAALLALQENAYENGGCYCDTCVVRTVLECIWPTVTAHVDYVLSSNGCCAASQG